MGPNIRRQAKPSTDAKLPDDGEPKSTGSDPQKEKAKVTQENLRAPPRRQPLRRARQSQHFLCNPAILVMAAVLGLVGTLLYFRSDWKMATNSTKSGSTLKPPVSQVSPSGSPSKGPTNPTGEILTGPFEVVDLPGRGKGVIATQDIKRGELIMRERPLFRLPTTTTSPPAQLVREEVAKLSLADRELFLDLWHPNHDIHPDGVPFDIAQVNTIAAGSTTGMFPRIARMNHGCAGAFNVIYGWKEEKGMMELRPFRDIKKGEELLVSYFDTKRPRSERRAYLHDRYHFHCECVVCSLPEKKSRTSDENLIKLRNLLGTLSTWPKGEIDGKRAIEITNQMWELSETEKYFSERGIWAADAAYVAATHSDAEATKAWLSVSAQWYTILLGADSERVMFAKRHLNQPRRHPGWGTRERMAVGGPAF